MSQSVAPRAGAWIETKKENPDHNPDSLKFKI